MNLKDLLYKIFSVFLIILQIFTTYVGFVAFFHSSIQIVFSYILALISTSLSSDWFAFISNFFWIFVAIAYIHLLVVINIKIILSFFKKIWKALDLGKVENRLKEFIENPKCCDKKYKIDRWGLFFLLVVLGTIIAVIIEVATTTDQIVCSLAFAGLSCYPPLFACFVVLFLCIPFHKPSVEPELNEITNEEEEEENKNEEDENENENEEDKNQVKKWQVYFDPSQIILQNELIDFINDYSVNDYRYFYYNHKIIPSFFITAIFLEYISYIIYSFVALDRNRDYSDILFFIIRIVYSFISFRFLIVFNPINFIINFRKIKEKHNFVWLTYLVAIAISIVILIAVGIAMIIIFCIFKPTQLNSFHYSPIYENVTFGEQASICQTDFYGINIMEYAGISAIGQTTNEVIVNEILKMVLNNRTYNVIPQDNPISYMYTIQFNESFNIRVFEALTDKTSYSFLLDLYMNDFVISTISEGIIPFYRITNNLLLYRYLYFLSMIMNRYLLLNLIHNFAVFSNNLYTDYDKVYFNDSKIIYVGHSIGGLIAKSVGYKRNVPSIAFESLNYFHSLFHMSVNLNTNVDFKSERLKILNIFSPSQIFAEEEKTSTINMILPQWKKIYQVPSAYETMCIIAAGCATDARYDQFCNSVIGKDSFLDLFEIWNRSRSDSIL